MNLQKLTDDELHRATVETAKRQREITLELLNQLNEIERRRLYSNFNCANLHDYCVNELKMSSGSACHHMNAAGLLKSVPAIEEKVLDGSITFTAIAQAEAFFKREARSGNKFDIDQKANLLNQLESKSTREADKILISHSSAPEIHLRETITQKTASIVEAKLHLDEETMELLNRLKEVWSAAMPHAKFADVIKRAAKEAIKKNDPLKKIERADKRATRELTKRNVQAANGEQAAIGRQDHFETAEYAATNAESRGATETPTPPTPALGLTRAEIRRAIWKRDQSRCTFHDPRTHERCTAKHFVEEDHIHPKAMGGEFTIENIRLRCRSHNQRHAIDKYGWKRMRQHLASH